MNYFLGFYPNQESSYRVGKIISTLDSIFDGQNIKVRWVTPDKYHISLLYLGSDLNFIERFLLDWKLKNFKIPAIKVKFDKVAVGISRGYKELVYFTIGEGGEEMRKLTFDLRNLLKKNDSEKFIPHLTLGRISKDLSDEEFKNITLDVREMNKGLKLDDISFTTKKLLLIQSDTTTYQVVKEYL
ncbi:MAG TPA: hypothetical protein VHA74_01080 [Candidatus Dojkabacteria bacterium]|nr:hypothetical protein [Candidatus Dojkabacteria bacterium]